MPLDTSRLAIHYPELADQADVPFDTQTAMEQLDALAVVYDQGLLSARPAFGLEGRLYFATDTLLVYYDTGAAWVTIGAVSGTTVGGDLSGTLPNPSVIAASGAFALPGDISPTSISSDQNNYNPTGLSGASTLRLSSSAVVAITGLQGGADGRVIAIQNVGSFKITLKAEHASSTGANRFATGATLQPGDGAMLQYDSTATRWRVIAPPASAGKAILRHETPIVVTGDTAEHDLISGWTLPGNELGTKGILDIDGWGYYIQNADSGYPRFRMYYGGTLLLDTGTSNTNMNAIAGKRYMSFRAAIINQDATHQLGRLEAEIARDSSDWALGFGSLSGDRRSTKGAADTPINIDSTVDQAIRITAQLDNAGYSVALYYLTASSR